MTTWLPDFVPLWALILSLGVFLYVLLDGFDLGVGMLYGIARNADARELIIDSIAPVWDGNETWLVLGGMVLLGAFPLAFAILIPYVYFPVLLMLLGLIFRGVAFEFRYRDRAHRTFWDNAFTLGSMVATLAQGIVVGAFIQGCQVQGRHFIGGSFACFTWFSLFTGIGLLFGYALLGAAWLILKTDGELQAWARRQARVCLYGVIIVFVLVSVWTPLMDPTIAARWFSWPNVALLSPVPLLTLLLSIGLLRSLGTKSAELSPFLLGIGLFVLAYCGIAISLWPMIVPHHYTLWQAASAPGTQLFLLSGTLFLLPIILLYSGWSYWVFRGKVRADGSYY